MQYMQSIHDDLHAECIEHAVDFAIQMDPGIGFVDTPQGFRRFYPTKKGYIQLMDACPGRTTTESDIDDTLIAKFAERLGRLHRATEDFDTSSYQSVNYHRDRLDEFRLLAEKFVHGSDRSDLRGILSEYTNRIAPLHPVL